MEQLLSGGEFLEFFVDGGRTRSGKPSAPKDGLLSVVLNAVMSGIISTVLQHLHYSCLTVFSTL